MQAKNLPVKAIPTTAILKLAILIKTITLLFKNE